MRCPGCGETNDEGYRFCRRCGRTLPEAPPTLTTGSPTPGDLGTPATHSLKAPTYRLVARAGLLAGRTFGIGPEGLTIGRDPAHCQVVVADDEISRLHAWIGLDAHGEVVVQDRRSANGTYVNQVRVKERVLRTSDEISFGTGRRQRFRVEQLVDPQTSPPSQATPGERATSRSARPEERATSEEGKPAGRRSPR